MKITFAILLGFIPVWLLSALLHTIDPDVNGINGLYSLRIITSVTIIALIISAFAFAPLVAFHRLGKRGYWIGLLSMSSIMGTIIAAYGSSATNLLGRLVSFGGVTIVCAITFFMATTPGVLALKSQCSRMNYF
jgi:hypothetical protein